MPTAPPELGFAGSVEPAQTEGGPGTARVAPAPASVESPSARKASHDLHQGGETGGEGNAPRQGKSAILSHHGRRYLSKDWYERFRESHKFYLTVFVTVFVAIGVLAISGLYHPGVATQAFLASTWGVGGILLMVLFLRWKLPIDAMDTPSAGRTTLCDAIGDARVDFMAEIRQTVLRAEQDAISYGGPASASDQLPEEVIREISVLASAASIATDLGDTLPKARQALNRAFPVLLACLLVTLPCAALIQSVVPNSLPLAATCVVTRHERA